MLESLAGSSTVGNLRGRASRHRPACLAYPRARPDARLPHSLVWRAANPHPGLAALRAHLGTAETRAGHVDVQRVLKASRQSSRDSPSSVKRHS